MLTTLAPLLATLISATCSGPPMDYDVDACDAPGPGHVYKRTHTELSFGYLGQWSDETNRSLELKPAATDPLGAGSITDPFLGVPFSGALQPGATLEFRVVTSGLRITTGFRWPFLNYRPSQTAQTMMLDGTPHDVLVRSVSLWDFRTGLGFELPFERVTPFVDVLGDVEHLTAQVAIDGATAKYTSTGFSLGGRLGLRVQLNHAFIAVAAEAMALGPVRLGGTVQVGVAL